MIEVTQQKIEELAPNAEAAKKGRDLQKKEIRTGFYTIHLLSRY